MCNDSHHASDRTVLSAAVLNHLKDLTLAAWRVYVFLCARSQDQPFPASVPTIAAATGLGHRSVIAALASLRERQLILRTVRGGNRPNVYTIVFPVRGASPSPAKPAKGELSAPPPKKTIPTETGADLSLVARLARA